MASRATPKELAQLLSSLLPESAQSEVHRLICFDRNFVNKESSRVHLGKLPRYIDASMLATVEAAMSTHSVVGLRGVSGGGKTVTSLQAALSAKTNLVLHLGSRIHWIFHAIAGFLQRRGWVLLKDPLDGQSVTDEDKGIVYLHHVIFDFLAHNDAPSLEEANVIFRELTSEQVSNELKNLLGCLRKALMRCKSLPHTDGELDCLFSFYRAIPAVEGSMKVERAQGDQSMVTSEKFTISSVVFVADEVGGADCDAWVKALARIPHQDGWSVILSGTGLGGPEAHVGTHPLYSKLVDCIFTEDEADTFLSGLGHKPSSETLALLAKSTCWLTIKKCLQLPRYARFFAEAVGPGALADASQPQLDLVLGALHTAVMFSFVSANGLNRRCAGHGRFRSEAFISVVYEALSVARTAKFMTPRSVIGGAANSAYALDKETFDKYVKHYGILKDTATWTSGANSPRLEVKGDRYEVGEPYLYMAALLVAYNVRKSPPCTGLGPVAEAYVAGLLSAQQAMHRVVPGPLAESVLTTLNPDITRIKGFYTVSAPSVRARDVETSVTTLPFSVIPASEVTNQLSDVDAAQADAAARFLLQACLDKFSRVRSASSEDPRILNDAWPLLVLTDEDLREHPPTVSPMEAPAPNQTNLLRFHTMILAREAAGKETWQRTIKDCVAACLGMYRISDDTEEVDSEEEEEEDPRHAGAVYHPEFAALERPTDGEPELRATTVITALLSNSSRIHPAIDLRSMTFVVHRAASGAWSLAFRVVPRTHLLSVSAFDGTSYSQVAPLPPRGTVAVAASDPAASEASRAAAALAAAAVNAGDPLPRTTTASGSKLPSGGLNTPPSKEEPKAKRQKGLGGAAAQKEGPKASQQGEDDLVVMTGLYCPASDERPGCARVDRAANDVPLFRLVQVKASAQASGKGRVKPRARISLQKVAADYAGAVASLVVFNATLVNKPLAGVQVWQTSRLDAPVDGTDRNTPFLETFLCCAPAAETTPRDSRRSAAAATHAVWVPQVEGDATST